VRIAEFGVRNREAACTKGRAGLTDNQIAKEQDRGAGLFWQARIGTNVHGKWRAEQRRSEQEETNGTKRGRRVYREAALASVGMQCNRLRL